MVLTRSLEAFALLAFLVHSSHVGAYDLYGSLILALGAGLHPDHTGRLERDDWQGGSRMDKIRKLAEALDILPAELLKD